GSNSPIKVSLKRSNELTRSNQLLFSFQGTLCCSRCFGGAALLRRQDLSYQIYRILSTTFFAGFSEVLSKPAVSQGQIILYHA
ncbi:hypothetical protein, partial [Salinithrix halophila]